MKILIATDVFPPKSGGSGWSTFYLARALHQRGHQIEVVLPKPGGPSVRTRSEEGLTVVEVGYRASDVPGWRARQRTRAVETTLGGYLAERAREFDLIHAQHVLSISAAVAAKSVTHVPVVSTVRDYWPVCLYGTLWRDGGICPICRGAELTRCLAQKYGRAARFMQPAVPLIERELSRRQRALGASDAVIAVSEFVANTLRDVVPAEKLCVVPNWIDVSETQRQGQSVERETSNVKRGSAYVNYEAKSDTPYFVFVGKLNALKGADLLPEILEKSGVEIPLVAVGDGELTASLARCKGIVMRGWLTNRETLAILAGARALLFPSRWADPLARTLLEAQALGVPTVALNTGGTRDIIEHNFNGLLADNVDEFCTHVRNVVRDEELRARLSENAKQVARTKFGASNVVSRLETIYADVVRRASP